MPVENRDSPVKTPRFFIVGAPKCGTTSMYRYLRAHPQVFMPSRVEMNFFGRDLEIRNRVETEEEYLSYFAGARNDQIPGEKTATCLLSKTAAAEIKRFEPAARIIVMLRNPVDAMYSLHGQLLYGANETIVDFEEALAAQEARRQGLRLPANVQNPSLLLYEDVYRFPEQLRRFFHEFDREQIHVIFFDDLCADPGYTYRRTLGFLGVVDGYALAFETHNPAKRYVPNLRVRQFMKSRPGFSRWIHRVLPEKIVEATRRVLALGQRQRRQMDGTLRSVLLERFSDDIEELGRLLGRDLTPWRSVAPGARSADRRC